MDDNYFKEKGKVYQDMIEEIYPEAVLEFIGNLDDVHSRFMIGLALGKGILFDYRFDNELSIRITVVKLNMYFSIHYTEKNTFQVKPLYDGRIPADHNKEPDFDFIKKILVNAWEMAGFDNGELPF